MNLKSLDIKNISRIIAHRVIPKTSKEDAYADHAYDLLDFKKEETDILINRLEDSLKNSKKTFKVEYDDLSPDSIYSALHGASSFSDEEFIEFSNRLATKLASAHFRTKIPGGYCLVGEGVTTSHEKIFFVIKAELQEVFSISGNDLSVIKNVFLSPAKDFYKIGFFIKQSDLYDPYMFDDQFSPQKKDLTEYFYSKFLGLTTDRNSRLTSKNFYTDARDFIEGNIENSKDRIGLLKALTVLYREEASGVISPQDFSDKYFEKSLKDKFDKLIQSKYPHSFTKDVSLIDNRLDLKRISIPLSVSVNIVGDSDALDDIEVIDNPDKKTIENIGPEINNGSIRKMVLLREQKLIEVV